MMANTWQGEFPWDNELLDGYERSSPVKRFPANGYGLYDMAGNVWEWTADPFTPDHSEPFHPCCAPEHGRGLRLLVNSTPMPRSSYTYFSRTPPGSAL